MDAGKRPKPDPSRGKPAARGPVRRAPARPGRPGKPAPEVEEDQDGAAVDLASAPSSSSGRERPPEDEEEAPADAEAEGEEVAEEASGSEPSEPSGREGSSGSSGSSGRERAVDPDETAETEAPSRPRKSRRERPEGKKGGKSERAPSAKAKSAPSRRVRAEAEDGEGDSGSREGRGEKQGFQRGISLGVKIALFTALLVAMCMGVLGKSLSSTAQEEIDKQINDKGVALAKILASSQKAIVFQSKAEPEETPVRNAEISAAQKGLAAFVAKEPLILNVMYFYDERGGLIVNSDQGTILAGIPPTPGKDAIGTSKIAERDGVGIEEGQYSSEGFTGRVRRYVAKCAPVEWKLPAGPNAGAGGGGMFANPNAGGGAGAGSSSPVADAWVHVFMKADEVDLVAEKVKQRILLLCGIGTGIALLLSIGMATFLAAPLRTLVSDMHEVAEGDLDHKTVPRSADEIGLAAYQFNEMTKSLRQAQKLEHERQAIENELSIATEIQTKLLPERIPQIPGIDLFSFYLSAKEVGGDYYDFLVIDPTHLGLIVADVSGKGIPGAMVMTMVRSLLRLASHRETSPAETLKKVNRILAKDIRRGMFVTAIYAVLDVQRKRLTVSSAGHNPMVFYEAATKTVRAVNPSGIALGFDKGRTFDENIREETIDLKPGDRCVVYTDGVVEAMSEKQDEFGMERFMELVKEQAERSSKDFTNGVVEELEAHRGRGEQSDDITITTLRVE